MSESAAPTVTPLAGVKVLDLSRLLPGPFCSLILADLGAEVLKVEDTGLGDYTRWTPPYLAGDDQQKRGVASPQFNALNRNKRSIQIDLKRDEGRDLLVKLAAEHDVLLESFRPGVLDRLGAGYEALRAVNDRLIYCAITGYGQDGPLAKRAGHDMNYLALNGLLSMGGMPDGPPLLPAGQIADIGGGAQSAAIAILAALIERGVSGRGRKLDVSMTDGALAWLAMPAARTLAGEPAPHRGEVELAGKWICYLPYEAADGWITVGALEPKFWAAFCNGIGRSDLVARQFETPGSETWREIADAVRMRTREQWAAFNAEHDCCIEPVLELDEALDSELVREREMVIDVEQPGVGTVRQLASPVKFDGARPARREPAPAFGEHTDEVLAGLGLTVDEIARLRADGVVAGVGAEAAVEGRPA